MEEKVQADKVVIKDLSQEYNHKINSILEDIDEIKLSLMYEKKNIILFNNRLHTLFVKLYPKIIKLPMGKEKVRKQEKYNIKFESNKHRIWITKRDQYGEPMTKFNKKYHLFKQFVERRELNLYQLMEEIGLTAKEKETRRVR